MWSVRKPCESSFLFASDSRRLSTIVLNIFQKVVRVFQRPFQRLALDEARGPNPRSAFKPADAPLDDEPDPLPLVTKDRSFTLRCLEEIEEPVSVMTELRFGINMTQLRRRLCFSRSPVRT